MNRWMKGFLLGTMLVASVAEASVWEGTFYPSGNVKTSAMVWVNVDSLQKTGDEVTYWYAWVNTKNQWGGNQTELGYETTNCSKRYVCIHEQRTYDHNHELVDQVYPQNSCWHGIKNGNGSTPSWLVRDLACQLIEKQTKKTFKNLKELINTSNKMLGVKKTPEPF